MTVKIGISSDTYGNGKTYLAYRLQHHLKHYFINVLVQSFAASLKEIALLQHSNPTFDAVYQAWDGVLNRAEIQKSEIEKFQITYATLQAYRDYPQVYTLFAYEPIKNRKLLQYIGTEIGRSIHPNIWVKQVPLDGDIVIMDDMRFVNEHTWCDFTIRIYGDGESTDTHVSEHQLNDVMHNMYIQKGFTDDDVMHVVNVFMEKYYHVIPFV